MSELFGPNVQLEMPFRSYNWKEPEPGHQSIDAYTLLDQRPVYGPVGHRESTDSFYEYYGTVIRSAPNVVPSPEQREQVEQLRSLWNAAETKLTDDTKVAIEQYKAAKADAESIGETLTFETWKKTTGYDKILETDTSEVNKYAEEKSLITQIQYPSNTKAIDAYTPPPADATTTNKAFMKSFINGTDEEWKPVYHAKSPQEVMNQLSSGGQELPISLSFSKKSSNMSKSWAGVDATINYDFFQICVDGRWEKFDLTETDQELTLNVNFKKIDKCQVTTGNWYDGGYLAKLAIDKKWSSNWSTEKVFGNKGYLPLKTTDLIVCIGMSLEVKVSQSSFEQNKQKWDAAVGIQIGPFKFGGASGGNSSDSWNRSSTNSTFGIELTDSYPYIIGYMVERTDGKPFQNE